MGDESRIREDLEIARLALGVSRQIDLADVAESFVRATLKHGRVSVALLYIHDSEQDSFHLKASHLALDDPRRRGILTLGLSELRAEGAAGSWPPALAPAPESLRHLGIGQVLAVPLPGAGALLGMLLLAHEGGAISLDEMDRIGRLVPELLPALVNALVVERFKDLIIKDDQSDCFNRRYFDRFLSEEVYRAHRYAAALSLIFLDMDNLKDINLRYGHAMGSKTVREVSRRLIGAIRGSDRLFRYGGDEFCVVLPETGLSGGRELAERLRVRLCARPMPADLRSGLSITASFGVSAYPEHARTSMGLIKCADQAMQRAKLLGKNSVCVAGADDEEPARALGAGE